jgi:hypothetical protein
MEKWFIAGLFLLGLYYYATSSPREAFGSRCPNVLIQNGNEILLKNTGLAEIPGVNPVVFHNLEEYTEFVEWQRSQGIKCPVLLLQKTYDAQNNETYKPQPVSLLYDATRDDSPYNTNSYPGVDNQNQDIGRNTPLDVYQDVGQKSETSPNAMDPNWSGPDSG